MSQQNFSVDDLRIASPCPVGWESMTGDERVRFCRQCDLHVYNISEMTGAEVRALVEKSEGRVCARLYRRADGKVLTRDCPLGLRAVRRRAARRAGAMLAALLSLGTSAFGQTSNRKDKSCPTVSRLKIKKETAKDKRGTFSGVVTDSTGAFIPGVSITLMDERTKEKLSARTTDEGEFSIARVPNGKYTFVAESPGFEKYEARHVELSAEESARVELLLTLDQETIMVGILDATPRIESGGGTTVITGEMLRSLPIPE